MRIEKRTDGGIGFELVAREQDALRDVLGHRAVREMVEVDPDGRVYLNEIARGSIKQALIKIGYPVDDRGGYLEGDPLSVPLRTIARSGRPFGLRPYQVEAARAFHAGGSVLGGTIPTTAAWARTGTPCAGACSANK